MFTSMDVHITRDCQIDGVFYEKWNQLSIDPSNFNADCMSPVVVPPTITHDADSDPPEEIPKPPKKHKK